MSYKVKLNQRIENGLSDTAASHMRGLLKLGLKMRGSLCIGRWPGLSDQVRTIKEKSIRDLDHLLEQAIGRMKENGFSVYRARTNHEALEYINSIVHGGLVIKSKSNATKEIGFTRSLEGKGCRVIETDLGDRICQLGNIAPGHPIGPAIHVPMEQVAGIFSRELGRELPVDAGEIVKAVRQALRKDFLRMDFGVSGANAIASDTGSVVLTENEGNIRLITSLAPVHIVVAGIEKVVPTLEDALNVVQTAAVYGVGQDIGTYITVLTKPPEADPAEGVPGSIGPSEVHVVLLEQGRWEVLRKNFEETLYCINCGKCLSGCPIYQEIGENYGSRYVGGIGVLHTNFREGREKALESGLKLCINCKHCTENCPLKIKTPFHILRLRRQAGTEKDFTGRLFLNRLSAGAQGEGLSFFIRNAERFLGKRDEGIPGWRLKRPLAGMDCRRLIPSAGKRPFLAANTGFAGRGGHPGALFFAGCLINLFGGDIGESALNVLRHLGVGVALPRWQACCSMPALAAGDWEKALSMIRENIELFDREDPGAIVTACATCGSVLKEYPALLEGDPEWHQRAVNIAGRVRDISVFLAETAGDGARWGEFQAAVTYHDPCHLSRAQGIRAEPRALLGGMAGLDLREMMDLDACCGFGGGFSVDFYNLSASIGAKKARSIAQTGADMVATGCPGCIIHIRDACQREGLPATVLHTVQIIERALLRIGG